ISGLPVIGSSPPRVPSPLRSTFSPREPVCAVPYSQFFPPALASSKHCCSGSADESIAQKEVTVALVVSFRPMSSPFGTARLFNSSNVHACVRVHLKTAAQASSAPLTPIPVVKLNLPTVDGRAPLTVGGVDGHVVVVVLVVVVVVVVVLVVLVTKATRLARQVSTTPWTVAESPVFRQSFGCFASSFAKQPLVSSRPPLYFAFALSTQPLAFGLGSLPGVCAVA